MPEIWVPFGAAMEMLQQALDLPPDGGSALEARVRQLAAADVPSLKRSAANARFRYGLTEIAELAIALVLIDGRMAPATAARYVTERWPFFAKAAIAGIGPSLPSGWAAQHPKRGGPFVVIEGNALSTLGKRAMREKTPEPLAPIACYATRNETMAALQGFASASWINAACFMPRIVELLGRHAVVPQDMWDSLHRLRQSEKPAGGKDAAFA